MIESWTQYLTDLKTVKINYLDLIETLLTTSETASGITPELLWNYSKTTQFCVWIIYLYSFREKFRGQ